MKHFRLIIFMALVLFIASTISAQTNNHNIIPEEKISFSFGVGHEYSILGFRLNYKLTDKIGLMASLSPFIGISESELAGLYPKIGLEYTFSNLFSNQRLVPYANVTYGVANFIRVTPKGTTAIVLLSKTFWGPTLGFGTKFKLFRKMRSYGNIGLQYVIVNKKERSHYVSPSVIVQHNYNDLNVSLGYTFILKSKTTIDKN